MSLWVYDIIYQIYENGFDKTHDISNLKDFCVYCVYCVLLVARDLKIHISIFQPRVSSNLAFVCAMHPISRCNPILFERVDLFTRRMIRIRPVPSAKFAVWIFNERIGWISTPFVRGQRDARNMRNIIGVVRLAADAEICGARTHTHGNASSIRVILARRAREQVNGIKMKDCFAWTPKLHW